MVEMVLCRVEGLGRAVVVETLVRLDLVILFAGAQRLFLGGMLGLFAKQGLAILLGDLIIIGVDSEKARKPCRFPP